MRIANSRRELKIGVWVLATLIIIGGCAGFIGRPDEDDQIAQQFAAQQVRFQRESRVPVLAAIMDAPSLFNYGPIWHVWLSRSATDETLACLPKLRSLKYLILMNCTSFSRESVVNLGKVESLENLDISRSDIRDEDLFHIAKAPRLKVISISDCPVTDAGLMHLATMKHLTNLIFYETQTTAEGRDRLKQRLPNLDIYVHKKQ